jgi:hypothetical protein
VSFYVEDLLMEARTGGTDEDAEALTDEDIELLNGFEYKVGFLTTIPFSVADPGCFIPDPDPTIAPSRIPG